MSVTIGDEDRRERSDLAMVDRAIRNDWPITSEMRSRAVQRIQAIIDNPQSKSRAVNAAIKTLASLQKLNLEATALLHDNRPQVVVVQNNTTNVDTLAQVVDGFKNPEDAQRFLELVSKSDYRPDNSNADRPAPPVSGGTKGNPPKLQ